MANSVLFEETQLDDKILRYYRAVYDDIDTSDPEEFNDDIRFIQACNIDQVTVHRGYHMMSLEPDTVEKFNNKKELLNSFKYTIKYKFAGLRKKQHLNRPYIQLDGTQVKNIFDKD